MNIRLQGLSRPVTAIALLYGLCACNQASDLVSVDVNDAGTPGDTAASATGLEDRAVQTTSDQYSAQILDIKQAEVSVVTASDKFTVVLGGLQND